jgi:oligopeptide transport system substrate-binding protein
MPSPVRRGLAPYVLATLLALTLAGCEQKASRPPCPPGKVCLEYGNGSDPSTLDPSKSALITEGAIIDELVVGLVDNSPDGKPVPGLATRWETSPDGLVWTFHLRPAKWSDGQPVTARDFVFTYRRMLDPNTAASYAYIMYLLKNGKAVNEGKAPPEALGAKALDDHTLQLTLEHPAPYLPQLMKHHSFYAVPEHVVRQWGDMWTRPEHYVSDGPYKLVSFKLGDYVRIEKNPLYYDADHVCIDRIDFYPTQDAISAERRVKRGELDVNQSFLPNRLNFLRHEGGMAAYVRTHPYLTQVYLTFNVRDTPPLRDPRVRQAFSMAIDRDFLTGKLLRAGQIPSTSFVPAGIAGYVPAKDRPKAVWADWPLAERQAKARALLAGAGYDLKHPLKLEIKLPGTGGGTIITESVQADLAQVGIKLRIAQEDVPVAYHSFEYGDFQVGQMGWIADYNDPMTYLTLMKSDTGGQNYGHYDSPAYDALIDQADNEANADVRARIMAKAEQIMLDDGYIVPLYTNVNLNLVSPRITGWVDNDVNIHRARYLCMKPA